MARYTGPKTRIVNHGSETIKLSKEITSQQHGMAKKRKKSEYAIQFMEKQKLNILMEF
jgi:ribosomal protein S4